MDRSSFDRLLSEFELKIKDSFGPMWEVLWNYFKDKPLPGFRQTIDALSKYDRQLTVHDFRMEYEAQKAAYLAKIHNVGPDCHMCDRSGTVVAESKKDGTVFAFKCVCPNGQSKRYPIWLHSLEEFYIPDYKRMYAPKEKTNTEL